MDELNSISDNTVKWLDKYYSNLKVSSNRKEVKGRVKLTATYNFESGKFMNLSNGKVNEIEGEILSGDFDLTISIVNNRHWSQFPALFINREKNLLTLDRHFFSKDNSACLCSPLYERTFLAAGFEFGKYFEELVIPFLYCQLYFDKHNEWPWPDYEHGYVGILESYYLETDSRNPIDCIGALRMDPKAIPFMQKILKKLSLVKGHIPCICGSGVSFRNCHPNAWKGLNSLTEDIRRLNIKLP